MHLVNVEFSTQKMLYDGTIGLLLQDVDAKELQKRIDSGEKLYIVGKRKPNAGN